MVASESSKKRLRATCADADALVKACDHDASSELTIELQLKQGLRADEEARDIERQSEIGLEFLRRNSLPCQDVLVIVQAVAQIFDGLEQEAAMNEAVLVIAQTAVLDANSDGKDRVSTAHGCAKIVEAKKILESSKSPLPLNLSLMCALLYKSGLVPGFAEFAGPGVDLDIGLQKNGKTSHAVILKDRSVASLSEVQNFVLVRSIQQEVLFHTSTDLFVDLIAPNGNRLEPGARRPAGAIFCTMWDSYNGEALGALEGKWGQQHKMLTGAAKLLSIPGKGVAQLVAKTLHLSKTTWRHVPDLVASLFNQVKAQAPDALKEKLVMPSELEVMAIQQAFRFLGLFDDSIRRVLMHLPQNAKKANLKLFKEGEQGKPVWDDYQASGHSAQQFSRHITRILTQDKKEKKRAADRAAKRAASRRACRQWPCNR